MDVSELIGLIVNNGFPVDITAYLLIRLESLASSINKLNAKISVKLGVAIDNDPTDASDNIA